MTSTSGPEEPARPSELVDFPELREMLGVAKARAYVITRYEDFPRPWYTSPDRRIRLWRRDAVTHWLDANREGWRDGH